MKTARRNAKKIAPRLRLVTRAKNVKTTKVVEASSEVGQLSPAQQEALIFKYRLKARKLGRSILRRWHCRMDLDEVDSIVDLSLCETVKRFDPSRGASFMTFLFYHLKGNLVRAVTAAAAATSVPLGLLEGVELGKGIPDFNYAHGVGAINASEIAHAISSQDVPQPDEALWMKQVTDCSASACEKLDALEREIIKRLFVHEQQIIDIAAALGYSRCHVSRIKKKALNTLHDELRVVMNHDDYALIDSEDIKELENVRDRISNRREVHRRRPRGSARRPQEIVTAKAA